MTAALRDPVWNALRPTRRFMIGGARARRYPSTVVPFAAIAITARELGRHGACGSPREHVYFLGPQPAGSDANTDPLHTYQMLGRAGAIENGR